MKEQVGWCASCCAIDNPWVSEQVLTWEDAYRHAHALAVAPYFGHRFGDPETAPAVAKETVDQLLDELESEVEGENRERIREQARAAAKYHLFLTAYEGGQHLAAFGGAENNEDADQALYRRQPPPANVRTLF